MGNIESNNLNDEKIDDENLDEVKKNNALHNAAKAGNLAEVQAQVSNFDINAKGEDDGTALYWAAKEGKTEVVELLLTFNPDVNISSSKYDSNALICSANGGHTEIVQALLKIDGINVNHAEKNGDSALTWAAENGHTEIVKALLKVDDINVNQATNSGYSALLKAVSKGHTEIVKELLKVDGINVNHANKNGNSALIKAAENGCFEIVQELLKIDGINVNHAGYNGNSALTMAVENGLPEIVKELLKVDGINVNHANYSGTIALTMAVGKYDTEIVKELLKIDGINVNHVDKDGDTALTIAVENGNTEIVKELLKAHEINVNHVNKVGDSALLKAVGKNGNQALQMNTGKGYPEIVKELLKIDGINVNFTDKVGDSALTIAAYYGHPEIVKELLKIDGINVNHAGKDGNSALIKAAGYGVTKTVQELLKIDGINVNYAGKDGYSALITAVAKGHTEIVKELLKIDGINVNHADTNGNSALIFAAASGRIEIFKELLNSHGINVNHADTNGNSALIAAVANGHADFVQELLKVDGINVNHFNHVDKNCDSALTMAVELKTDSPILKYLLKVDGINVNHVKNDGNTAMHRAAMNGKVGAFVVILSHGGDVSIKNKQGMSCFDVMKSARAKLSFLTKTELNLSILEAHKCFLWFVMVQVADTTDIDLFSKLLAIVEVLVSSHPSLAAAKDADGRAAVDVASKPMKLIMQSVLLWHGRYRITEPRPEHISATCFVFKGVDEHTIDSETSQPIKVALKLMRLKDQFQREISTRDNDFNNQMVMNVLQQVRPNLLHKVASQVDKGGMYYSSQMGMYSKSSYRCVEKALVETVYRLRPEDPSKLVVRYRCSKHKHDLSLAAPKAVAKKHCKVCYSGRAPAVYTCIPCDYNMCENCFNKVDDHQVFPEEGTTWIFTIQDGKDQAETELARSDAPTIHVSDAVFTNIIKVSEGENGTVVVIDVQATVTRPDVTEDNEPDEVVDVEADATGQLTKTNAEKFYLMVMPLADRNLFVALKQERWAGTNMEEVRHIFVQLVHCVEHMHDKGVLHADLKTLNIVRTAGQWKLIDLDAACVIGKEPVGHKSSSAYVPPEAIYIDEKTDTACVRSVVAVTKGKATYELLTAHPSFDVWSLGCILYQMVNNDVKPLFQGGQDDNLVGMRKGVDNLFALAEWSPELKAEKLADVPDKLARNLLSQMLHKDPLQRPSLSRVLAHSFLSGKKVARLVGENPKYDLFLSYRVASDSHHVEKLYNLLTAQGFKVYWDKLCLEPGVDWEQGFCEGLVSSRAFVPLLSRDAINHPDKAWQNFSKLTTDSKCDNVFLEHRLAVELQGLGLIEKIFPVFIGNVDTTTSEYSNYFGSGCHPSLSEVTVTSVEEKLRQHMESQALGTPIVPDRTVVSVVGAITACQGAFIVGPADASFAAAADSIAKMLTDAPIAQSPRADNHVHQTLLNTMDIKTVLAENSALKGEVDTLSGKVDRVEAENVTLKGENGTLKAQRETVLASLNSAEFTTAEAVIAHMKRLLQG